MTGLVDVMEEQKNNSGFASKMDDLRMRLEGLKLNGALVGRVCPDLISLDASPNAFDGWRTPPPVNRSRSLNVSPVKQRMASPAERFVWTHDAIGERAERAVMSDTVPDDGWEKRLKLASMQSRNVERASALQAHAELQGKELGIAGGAVGGRGQRMSTDALLSSFKDPEGPRALNAGRVGGAVNEKHSYSVVGRQVKPLLTDEEKLDLCLADIREQNRLLRVQKRHLRDEVEAMEEADPGAIQTAIAHSGMSGVLNRSMHHSRVGVFQGATTSLIGRRQVAASRRFESMPASRDLRLGGFGGF